MLTSHFIGIYMSNYVIFLNVSLKRAATAQTNLCIHTVSIELSLLAYTKYGALRLSLEVNKLEYSLKLKLSAMICCLRTRVCKQPIIALYFENEVKFYNLGAQTQNKPRPLTHQDPSAWTFAHV